MEGPTYKGRELKGGEGRGKGIGRVPPVITVSLRSRGARIVTGLGASSHESIKLDRCRIEMNIELAIYDLVVFLKHNSLQNSYLRKISE